MIHSLSGRKECKGFGLVETIVAMAIFIILVSGGAAFTVPALRMNRLGGTMTDATLFAQEGIEAARSIKKQGWTIPFLATDCTGGCGISVSGGVWVWSGTTNTKPPFLRTIVVSSVSRDGSGTIVSSGGVDDPDTKKVTVTVTWSVSPTRPETVTLVTYLTNWGGQNVTPTPTMSVTPTVSPTPTPTPTPTSMPSTCHQYCLATYGSSGVCAKSNNCKAPKLNVGRIYECTSPNFCCCQ